MSYSEKELDKLRDAIESVRCYSDVLDGMEEEITNLKVIIADQDAKLDILRDNYYNLEDEHEQLKLDYAESVKERLELADVIKILQE
jgi:hypothetical protein